MLPIYSIGQLLNHYSLYYMLCQLWSVQGKPIIQRDCHPRVLRWVVGQQGTPLLNRLHH